MPFIPHTKEDTQAMLSQIGADSTDTLFDEIPNNLRIGKTQAITSANNEMQLLKFARKKADENHNGICFIGAGCYEHHIPAAVWDLTMRGEFLTAYTPYQAEVSQGTLQLLYEFQTMIAELTALEVANASMYDGATALAEALLMAIRLKKSHSHKKILIPESLHPYYWETIQTILTNQDIELISLPFDRKTGVTDTSNLQHYADADITALVINYPNFFGNLEPVDALTNWARKHEAISIGCVNPIALGLLKPPGAWGEAGVDIACGEGQPLGSPMASGGPFFGFFSSRQEYVRQMPGRIIGQTTDSAGNRGYTLTLQAREQHIRRAKATSNICTNQGLLVTAATIHMSLLGAEGLRKTASVCAENTHMLVQELEKIPGVSRMFNNDFFHEVLIELPCSAKKVLHALQEKGIAGGYPIEQHFPDLPNSLLICATEMRTTEEIKLYALSLKEIIKNLDVNHANF